MGKSTRDQRDKSVEGNSARRPLVTAVVCTYNRYQTLGATIESLQAQSLRSDEFDITVVDNSPDHEASLQAGEQYRACPNMFWIVEKTPGLSNARNVGTRAARAPFVAFIDDDAVAEPSWLERILSVFDEFGERACVVGGRVDPIWDSPRPNWLPDEFLAHLSVVNWEADQPRPIGEKEWLAGTNIAFRVDTLNSVGGFSTQLGRNGSAAALLSNEETEVSARIKALGHLVLYAPDARVGHRIEASRLTHEWFRRRIIWQAVSDYLQNGKKHFDEAPAGWSDVLHFANSLPPRDRSLRALYVPFEDPQMFAKQVSALYNYTIALLTGFRGVKA
jgi:glycosyltransferase involved in cell wall biosynthesis